MNNTIPQEIKDKIAEYASDDMLCIVDVAYGYSLALPEISALKDEVERLREALTKISNWELPETGQFWDKEKTQPVSFEAEYGSNGARDYMRNLASKTLSNL